MSGTPRKRGKATRRSLRTHVERGIFKRETRDGRSRYEVAYQDSDGRQRWKTASTLGEARLIRADLVTRVAAGERVAPAKVTLAEFADDWLAQQQPRLRASTYAGYETYVRLCIKPRLGKRKLGTITVDDIASLIVDMEQGYHYRPEDGRLQRVKGKPYAAWTIKGVLVVLGRIFARATRLGLITSNPVRRLEKEERPKSTRREFPSLDREAIGKLIAATPERYRTLVALSLLTGIRQSEALGLRWQDIDTDAGLLRIRLQLSRDGQLVEPKTAAAKREIPIPPSLTRLLATHKQHARERGFADPTDFVFCSLTGGPLNHRNIARRGLEKALATAGLPKLTWHDLRHVAASALIAEGASVAYLSRLLGHASPSITLSIYAHDFARAEHAERTRERMEQAFGSLLSPDLPALRQPPQLSG